MNRKILLVGAIFFSVVLFLFPYSSKAQIRVNRTVNPGDSIQQAINEANENDIIFVSPGTYHEQSIIVNKTLTIVGTDVETCIVDGDGTNAAIFVVRANGVKIMNLTVQNTYTEAGYGISADGFSNIIISNCIIRNCYIAVRLANCTYCEIARNIVKDNYYTGIYLHFYSSYNIIFGNVIQNNTAGLLFESGTTQNKVFQNNFINNSNHYAGFGVQTNFWNWTYPFGGNFWDDYHEADRYSGYDQSDEGSDGIGDVRRTISGDAADFYPLMAPIRFLYAGTWNECEYYVAISTYFNISNFLFYPNETSPYVSYNLADAATNSCRVTIPKTLLWTDYIENWTILINQSQPEFLKILEDNEYTYFFFNFKSNDTLSFTIKIIGTYAIPELTPLILLTTLIIITIIMTVEKRRIIKSSKIWLL